MSIFMWIEWRNFGSVSVLCWFVVVLRKEKKNTSQKNINTEVLRKALADLKESIGIAVGQKRRRQASKETGSFGQRIEALVRDFLLALSPTQIYQKSLNSSLTGERYPIPYVSSSSVQRLAEKGQILLLNAAGCLRVVDEREFAQLNVSIRDGRVVRNKTYLVRIV